MKDRKPLSKTALREKFKEAEKYFYKNKMYFMLLCHDRRDYTLFRLVKDKSFIEASAILRECLENRGRILDIEPTNDNALEIWLLIEDEAFCYYLFPYDEAIIEC